MCSRPCKSAIEYICTFWAHTHTLARFWLSKRYIIYKHISAVYMHIIILCIIILCTLKWNKHALYMCRDTFALSALRRAFKTECVKCAWCLSRSLSVAHIILTKKNKGQYPPPSVVASFKKLSGFLSFVCCF